ncbi:MAG TPA: uroporphyrinogen-III C-methyltransferase, partial [Bacillota bacterium]|nr:uroporphyrinogen-III C-methyltransferase [Bacillota bacterium]
KGGDPCIFGRVGEEAEVCVDHGIPFEIIPGITSGIAAPAYAGIPLTHRDYNASIAIITGHRSEKNEAGEVDLQKVAGMETIVIYMGMKHLARISAELIRFGKDQRTPVALIRWGTTGEQETLVGDLSTISQKAKQYQFTSPAIIIVGEVVKLREQLNWFEQKILLGKKVLLLDEPHSNIARISQLEEWGAEVISIPAYQWKTVSQQKWIDLVHRIEQYGWIIIANSMEASYFFEYLREQRIDIRRVTAKVVACGQETADFLEGKGIIPTIIWTEQSFSLTSILESVPIPDATEVLVLNQAGNGNLKTEMVNGFTIHATSFYEKQYIQARILNQLVQNEKFDLVVLTQTNLLSSFASWVGDAQTLVLAEEGQWTENYISKKLHEKIQCIS